MIQHTHERAHQRAHPRTLHLSAIATIGALSCLLSACGGGGDDHGVGADNTAASPKVTEAVPANASTDAAAATAYTSSLSATPAAESDALEPVPVPEQLASDDTAEPA